MLVSFAEFHYQYSTFLWYPGFSLAFNHSSNLIDLLSSYHHVLKYGHLTITLTFLSTSICTVKTTFLIRIATIIKIRFIRIILYQSTQPQFRTTIQT